MALLVLHLEDLLEGPVEVISEVRYLPGQLFQGVAYDSPTVAAPVPMST